MSDKETQTEGIPIRVRLTADDYAGFNLYHGRWQLAGLFLFYWILFVLLLQWSGSLGESSSPVVLVTGGFLLGACLLAFQLWRIRARTVKIFDKDKLSQLEQNILLTEEGIRHSTGETTVAVPWDDVHKAAETSKAVIIYLARNKVIMLPKREMDNVPEVKQAFRRHLPAEKLKFKP